MLQIHWNFHSFFHFGGQKAWNDIYTYCVFSSQKKSMKEQDYLEDDDDVFFLNTEGSQPFSGWS